MAAKHEWRIVDRRGNVYQTDGMFYGDGLRDKVYKRLGDAKQKKDQLIRLYRYEGLRIVNEEGEEVEG